ncbi:hypothetical protein DL765_009602 [Monosporascus sp. GIB2]|nr:hypothetical protein DL765_009602 [Monosporascus sp. GIB2]
MRMHPPPSLAESFPKDSQSEERVQHASSHQGEQPGHQPQPQHVRHGASSRLDRPPTPAQVSTPVRKDTASSSSTNASDGTAVTNATGDTNATAYSVESSQSIFSVKDGTEISSNRRASRRRTGPLSAQQREKAALIRKLGACADCRRRRVACHPNHHNMTWEEAVRKYRSSSPLQDLASLTGRPISPASKRVRLSSPRTSQEMEIDSTSALANPQTTPGRAPLSEARLRTPLPSGPRLDKAVSMPPLAAAPAPLTALQNIVSIRAELEGTASRMLSSPHRSRYTAVSVLLIHWQDDGDPAAIAAVDELSEVFNKVYHYSLEVAKIPSSKSDGCKNSWRWLSRTVDDFSERNDTRDVLKIVYYSGYSFLDEHRHMVLARYFHAPRAGLAVILLTTYSARDRRTASTIRWSGIQQILEEACSDTLIIMDAAYYPSSNMVRQKGVLELIAASSSEGDFRVLERGSFTRNLAEQLRMRASQRLPNSLSAAELHSRLLSIYSKFVQDKSFERETTTNLPSPLYMQMSSNSRLPSITLSPVQPPRVLHSPEPHHGPQLSLSFRLSEETLNPENWIEWLRMMPEGVKDVRVDGPYTTFR